MNYAFKLQSSTCVYSPVSTSISSNSGNIVRAHCFRKYLNSTNNGKNYSTNISALKLLTKKKLNPAENVNKKLTSNKYEKASYFSELIKVQESKSKKAKMKILQEKTSQGKEFSEKHRITYERLYYCSKYICDSTRSFDPNLLILNEDVLKFYEQENSSIEFNVEDEKKSYNIDILESFPLRSVKILPLPKRNKFIENKTKVDTKKLKEDHFNNNSAKQISINHTTNLKLLEKENQKKKYLVENLNKNLYIADSEEEYLSRIDNNFLYEGKKIIQFIQSYIDVAVNCNKLTKALNMLSESRKKQIWKSDYVKRNATELYNIVMNSYGLLGDWTTVSTIRNWMESDEVHLNYQSYAALLDCLGRTSNDNIYWHQEVAEVLQDLRKMKHSISGLFTETILNINQRQNILSVIQKILPDFDITSTKINLKSTCNLVSDLYLKKNNLLSQIDNHCIDKSLEDLVNMQVEVEKNFSVTIKPIPTQKTTFGANSKEKLEYLESLKKTWRMELEKGFLEGVQLKIHSNLGVYLTCLSPNSYVNLMMEEIDNLSKFSESYSQSTIMCYKILGEKVERRYEIQKKIEKKALDNSIKLFHKYCDWYANPNGPAINSRQQLQMILQENVNYHPAEVTHFKWPSKVTIDVGKFLYDIIFRKVKLNISTKSNPRWVPVFYRIIRFNSISQEQIKCYPKIANIFKELGFYNLIFETSQCPMLCPPKPWISVNEGGYLSHSSDFYRKSYDLFFKSIDLRKIPSQKLYAAFDSLNALQNTPWKINEPVLDVILEVFKSGGCDNLDVAKYPEKVEMPSYSFLNATEILHARKEFRKLVKDQKDRYSLWCEALYRLSLANHFRKQTFWLPYNFDFRGRLYPIPPLINHLASDTYRALLLFAKGKPLGTKGLDWIKIHAITLTGTHKKQSLDERLKYANSILPDILDSAKNPLTGDGWWKKSDEPWQTLAACMEIKKALDSSCPESYITHLPIHQDGSCNGLQHYAALGRDSEGGISVNLTPRSEPQDVYSVVTAAIEKKRVVDAENGVDIAKALKGHIFRKVVKQTIMTTVYGVTMYGAKLQIAKQLNAIENFPQEYVWQASTYLAHQTFECLKEMFSSARDIQSWLTECANIITEQKKYVKWISPIGLPIMQPYSSPSKPNNIEGLKSSVWIPNRRKQRAAFPPNFIHSLDSSHLMLTALFCEQAGLTFASIHDCFWTHPTTVDIMNKICREQFVSLHSQPILKNLSEFFIRSLQDKDKKISDKESLKIFKDLPRIGDLDLTKVLESVYFFS